MRYLTAELGTDVPRDIYVSKHTVKGYLTKLGDRKKNWKKRWFFLDLKAGLMSYFTDDRTEKRCGEIRLSSVCKAVMPTSMAAKRDNLLLFVTEQRTYQLKAPSAATCACWCKLFQVIAPSA